VQIPGASDLSDPAAEYRRRLGAQRARLGALGRWMTGLLWGRLAVLFLVLCLAYEACARRSLGARWALLAAGLFVVVSAVISWLAGVVAQREATVAYCDRGLARIEERWAEGADGGDRFVDEAHPFSGDLDLFGKASLYGLLNVTRTSLGQEALARWLTTRPSVAEMRQRQEAVGELAPRVDLREQLWQAGGRLERDLGREPAQREHLSAWLDAPVTPVTTGARVLVTLLGVAGLGALGLLAAGRVLPALAIFAAQVVLTRRHAALSSAVAAAAWKRANELKVVGAVVERLESERFTSAALIALRETVTGQGEGVTPRRRLRGLVRAVGVLDSRRNVLFALVTAPLLLGTQMAFAIEVWRRRHARVVRGWLDAVGSVEALSSLATYRYEHPDHPFPEIADDSGGPILEGEGLAHPLMKSAVRRANDVALGGDVHLILVTGSNMSGKSTMLRTLGTNAVLAMAGAPVCARRLRLTPLSIGATLRTQDSLAGGVSRFFAEVQRLRAVVGLAESSPLVLFLLDEILGGTNSQDRERGGEAIIRTLVERGAVGLVTTHDLALARLGDDPSLHARNAHFQDRIEDGRLIFDYQMRPGVVSRSNALDLMRMVGLKV
jgi:hypothetical protein